MRLNNQEPGSNLLNSIFQIVQNIEAPLSTLIEESGKINTIQSSNKGDTDSKEIIFSNTLEIKGLIDQVLEHIKSSQEEEPMIFNIYHSNNKVQSMCKHVLDPRKISKYDKAWLMDLEKEVYENVDRSEIHLGDLAYNLAVSKRQLNRKVLGLLHLTPNKYIRVLKLHRAKELIDEFTCGRVSEISYAVGYSDTHYFSKLFHQQYGVTPKELIDEKGW